MVSNPLTSEFGTCLVTTQQLNIRQSSRRVKKHNGRLNRREATMANSRLVLVTGVTGQQGGSVARSLITKGHRVRGMTRNVESEAARAVATLGVDLVAGDFRDPDSLAAAVAGVDTVFAMGTPFEAGEAAEVARESRLWMRRSARRSITTCTPQSPRPTRIRGSHISTASGRSRNTWPRPSWTGASLLLCTSWRTSSLERT